MGDGLPTKLQRAPTVLIGSPDVVAPMRLPPRSRFIVLMYDSSPSMVPIDDPGLYEIDVAAIKPDVRFPVALMVVKAKHAHLFEKMDAAYSNRVIDACRAAVRRGMQ